MVAYPAISFFAFFGVRAFLYITYYGFSTLLFARNVPRHFIFYISLGTRLLVHHLLWLQHTPIHQKRTPTFYFCHFSGYNPPPHHPHSSPFSFSCVSNSVSPTGRTSPSLLAIHLRQPEAHLPHYLPYTFADISDTSGTVSTMPSVPEMPLITSMPIEYIFTTCMYGIM